MADFLDASVELISFSDAITSELAHGIKQITLPAAINIIHDASDMLTGALIADIEQNVENGTMSCVDLEDKCQRFAARSGDFKVNDGGKLRILLTAPEIFSDEEEIKPKCLVANPIAKLGGIRKTVLRSLPSNRKRTYAWKQPLKNKARHYQRLETAEGETENTKAKPENGIEKQKSTPFLKLTRDILDDGDSIDELFDETDEEDIEMADTEDESDDSKEDEEEYDSFDPDPQQTHTPPSTTRQLAIAVRKNMDELYHLATINPSKPESVRGYELPLRQAVDKVRFGDARDLAPEEIVTLHEAVAQVEYNRLTMGL